MNSNEIFLEIQPKLIEAIYASKDENQPLLAYYLGMTLKELNVVLARRSNTMLKKHHATKRVGQKKEYLEK